MLLSIWQHDCYQWFHFLFSVLWHCSHYSVHFREKSNEAKGLLSHLWERQTLSSNILFISQQESLKCDCTRQWKRDKDCWSCQWLQFRYTYMHSIQEALGEACSVSCRCHIKNSQTTELMHNSNWLGLKSKRNHCPHYCFAQCYWRPVVTAFHVIIAMKMVSTGQLTKPKGWGLMCRLEVLQAWSALEFLKMASQGLLNLFAYLYVRVSMYACVHWWV